MTTLEQPHVEPTERHGFFSQLNPRLVGVARGAVEAVIAAILAALITYFESVEVGVEYAFVPAVLVLLLRAAEGVYDQRRRA